MELYRKYRPKRLSQVVGQDKCIEQLRLLMSAPDWDRDAIWLEGASGIGKSCIAQALAAAVGADTFMTDEIDGDQCNVERVRQLSETINLYGWGGTGWRVYIIDEAHGMTDRAVQAWLTLLERLPARRLIIFTTTEPLSDIFGKFSHPFKRRVKYIKLSNQGLCESFARLAMKIATRENLNGKPLPDYVKLMKRCGNSLGDALQEIQLGKMQE